MKLLTIKTILPDKITLSIGRGFRDLGLKVGVRSAFVDGQYEVESANDETKGYSVHDIYVDWSPQNGVLEGFDILASVDNVFDRQYQIHTSDDPSKGQNFKLAIVRKF